MSDTLEPSNSLMVEYWSGKAVGLRFDFSWGLRILL